MMASRSRLCSGFAATGSPCRRRTRNPDGLCGECVGGPPVYRSAGSHVVRVFAPGDPFASGAPTGSREPGGQDRRRVGLPEEHVGLRSKLTSRVGAPGAIAMAAVNWVEGFSTGAFGRDLAGGAYGTPTRLLLRVLARSRTSQVITAVAANERTPPGSLRRIGLSADNLQAREHVAKNPNTPSDVLDRLAADPNIRIRTSVAANPGTDPRIVGCLSGDPDAQVCVAAIRNPNCPPDRVEAAVGDRQLMVATAAARQITNEPALRHISRHRWPEVRAVAAERSADPGTLARLAADPDPDVRAAALANPETPAHGRAAAGLLN